MQPVSDYELNHQIRDTKRVLREMNVRILKVEDARYTRLTANGLDMLTALRDQIKHHLSVLLDEQNIRMRLQSEASQNSITR